MTVLQKVKSSNQRFSQKNTEKQDKNSETPQEKMDLQLRRILRVFFANERTILLKNSAVGPNAANQPEDSRQKNTVQKH